MRRAFAAVFVATILPAVQAAEPDRPGLEFFERKIRPVLVKHCYECHSAEAKKVQANLLLDTREAIRRGGDSGPAVLPGKVEESLILAALRGESVEMPPTGKLPDEVIADFEKWIKMGAPDPRVQAKSKPSSAGEAKYAGSDFEQGRKWWSFQPPRKHAPPAVKNVAWPRGDIDRFILARLEPAKLLPAPDTDRHTLIRRVYFDLIGLPPTPEEIDAFVGDADQDAFAKVVDRLLASSHFGERFGRHWLDVARYSDSTGGGRTKIYGNAWRYRDYVIDSFNRDKPYDQFVIEQIAGDLLPGGTLAERQERMTALAFLVLGPTNYETQDKELLRMDVVDEQIDTMGRTFLGMTIGCARCHDHKFDPIPTADYYALAGIFRSTKTLTPGNVSGYVERPLPLPAEEEAAWQKHEAALKQQQSLLAAAKAELAKLGGQPVTAAPAAKQAAVVKAEDLPGIVVDDVRAKVVGQWTASKFTPGYVGDGYIHDGSAQDGQKSVTYLPDLPKSGEYEVRVSYTSGTNRATNVPVEVRHAEGETTVRVNQQKAPPIDKRWQSLGRFKFEQGTAGAVVISNLETDGHVIADAVQFLPADADLPLAKKVKSAGSKPAKEKGPEPTAAVKPKADAAALAAAQQTVQRLEAELKALERRGPGARPLLLAVVDEAETDDYFVCIRGNPRQFGKKTPRGFLSVTGAGTPSITPGQSGRLELARWLASRDNPLTARVMVNRVWHYLLGAGLVRTPDNFGHPGERPTHPELLDHLALQFMNDGWSVKRLIRSIVLSRTYGMSSEFGMRNAELTSDGANQPAASGNSEVRNPNSAFALDPDNRLLSHANRRRLDAEAIRDTVLAFSGQLDRAAGGDTIRPGTATEIGYEFNDLRRSVYVPVFRNRLCDILEVFDFPDPNAVAGSRVTSTLPTQALFLMNSPFIRAQAQHAARRLLAEPGLDDAGRIDLAFRRALGRPPRDGERELAERLIRSKALAATDAEKERLATWSSFCQSLISCVDFRYLD
jgi:hypothetical protein